MHMDMQHREGIYEMRKAYITQERPDFSYNRVEDYGRPVFITRHDYMSIDGTEHNKHLTSRIYEVLEDFQEEDYLVPSGSPLVTGVAIAALAQRFRTINILRWSNRDYTYYPFRLNIR